MSDSSAIDEGILAICLEIELYKKKLEDFIDTTNQMDKNLAETILSTCELITDFTNSSEICTTSLKTDTTLKHTLDAFENKKIEVDSNSYCIPCNQEFKFDELKFVEHVSSTNHQNACNKYEASPAQQQVTMTPQIIKKNPFLDSITRLVASDNNKIVGAQKPLEKREISPIKEKSPPSPTTIKGIGVWKVEKNETKLNDASFKILKNDDLDLYVTRLVHSQFIYFNENKMKNKYFILQLQRALHNIRYFNKLLSKKVVCHIFGSTYLELANEDSDLDIYIDLGNTYYKKLPRADIIEIINVAAKRLEKFFADSQYFSCVDAITSARTPILRVWVNRYNIRCDLSFGNGLCCYNSKLLLYYMKLQPITRKLITFIRNWTKLNEINFNGYSVSLLVVFFLQISILLPPVEHLQRYAKELIFDDWNAGIIPLDLDQLKIQPVNHFDIALMNFFHYYGYVFEYDNNIVCPFLGQPIKKTDFDLENIDKLPKEFARFKAYMSSIDLSKADKVCDLFANSTAFVVQDPFELNHNVTKSVSEATTIKFEECCKNSYDILIN